MLYIFVFPAKRIVKGAPTLTRFALQHKAAIDKILFNICFCFDSEKRP